MDPGTEVVKPQVRRTSTRSWDSWRTIVGARMKSDHSSAADSDVVAELLEVTRLLERSWIEDVYPMLVSIA